MLRRVVPEPVDFSLAAGNGGNDKRMRAKLHFCAPTDEVLRRNHPPIPQLHHHYKNGEDNNNYNAVKGKQRKTRVRSFDLGPREARAYERIAATMQLQREAAVVIQRAWRNAQSRKLIRVFAGRRCFKDFKSQLAYRLLDYHQRRKVRRIMLEWSAYARRLHALRHQMMVHARRERLLSTWLREWKLGTKYRGTIRKGLQHLYIYQTQHAWRRVLVWLVHAKRLHRMQTLFNILHKNRTTNQQLKRKWLRWAAYYHIHTASSKIQAGCRGYLTRCRIRRLNKMSRLLFGCKRAFGALRRRKMKEQKRFATEQQVIRPIIALTASVLSEYLSTEEGETKLQELRQHLKDEQRHRFISCLMPWRGRQTSGSEGSACSGTIVEAVRLEQLPLFHRCKFVFSINHHTMDVLSQRCREGALHLARRNYRRSHRPLHECMRCGEVFMLRVLRDFHKKQQPRDEHTHCARTFQQEYSSVTWHHSKGIVDSVIEEVQRAYYSQEPS